jgi:hypothetical protein
MKKSLLGLMFLGLTVTLFARAVQEGRYLEDAQEMRRIEWINSFDMLLNMYDVVVCGEFKPILKITNGEVNNPVYPRGTIKYMYKHIQKITTIDTIDGSIAGDCLYLYGPDIAIAIVFSDNLSIASSIIDSPEGFNTQSEETLKNFKRFYIRTLGTATMKNGWKGEGDIGILDPETLLPKKLK